MSYEEPDFKEEMLREQLLCKRARRVLGVGDEAGPEAIKRAYWRFALAYHPDRDPRDRRRAEKFALIAEAYDILVNHTNPPRRHTLNRRDDYVVPPLDEQEYCRWWVRQFGELL